MFLCGVTFGLRVTQADEMKGLDVTTHGEYGYNVLTEDMTVLVSNIFSNRELQAQQAAIRAFTTREDLAA